MSESENKERNADIQEVVARIRKHVDRSSMTDHSCRFTYLIGSNGVGKSRILTELARYYEAAPDTAIKTIPCITDGVYDKFPFTTRSRKIRYLGARNAPNAVFQAAIERTLALHILNGIVEKTRFMARFEKFTGMKFELRLAGERRLAAARKAGASAPRLEDFVDKRKFRFADLRSKLTEESEQIVRDLLFTSIVPSRLTKVQAAALRSFVELNPEIHVLATKSGREKPFPFGELSSGEKSRTLFAAKLLAAADHHSLILIDEPENSLHLHWQLTFHEGLADMLGGLRNFHVVVATHSPIIVSQSARSRARDSEVLVLHEDGTVHDKVQASRILGTQIASYDDVLLDLFDTATFQTRSIKERVADVMLRLEDDPQNVDARKQELMRLRDTEGIDDGDQNIVNEAIDLLKKFFGAQA